jgi:alcohol dehydrogenase class IV
MRSGAFVFPAIKRIVYGQPQRLAEVSVTREHFPVIASHAMEEHYIHANPRQITRAEQVLEILEAAA